MSWKFAPSDNFGLKQLYEWRNWFQKDLRAANSWYKKVQTMPESFPGRNWTLKIAADDLKISTDNLNKCKEAIKLARKRNK